LNAAWLTPQAQQRFEELLPWYANRTLNGPERCEVESLLATSSECRAALNRVVVLARHTRRESLLQSTTYTLDLRAGLDKLMAMVHAHESGELTTLVQMPSGTPTGA
jgi:hypothetical protein